MMRRRSFHLADERALPRIARGDPAAGARLLAEMIPAAIARAEALGVAEVAGHLRMALLVAERSAAGSGGQAKGE